MNHLFSPISLRELTLRNRIMMSPMCIYSAAKDGIATDWHFAHYLSRAVGGVGLIILEATAVERRGRISPNDLGLWESAQIEALSRLTSAIQQQGAAVGVQLAHAGRKAFSKTKGIGPQTAVAPSSIAFDQNWSVPAVLDEAEIDEIVVSWRAAAERAILAGFDMIEIHAAHGYLIHQFLSPISNKRFDQYGGDHAGRMRFLLRIVRVIREVMPDEMPLMVRVSSTDWVDGGLMLDDLVEVSRELKAEGVDIIDCSSGGLTPVGPAIIEPGYQVPFAQRIRDDVEIATVAVGLITEAEQANKVIRNRQADIVALGRELLRNPYWSLNAARVLNVDIDWPPQYERAKPT
ncbi:MAG: NADPH dehydrogenase NamA [Chloroflexota bacterium]